MSKEDTKAAADKAKMEAEEKERLAKEAAAKAEAEKKAKLEKATADKNKKRGLKNAYR